MRRNSMGRSVSMPRLSNGVARAKNSLIKLCVMMADKASSEYGAFMVESHCKSRKSDRKRNRKNRW